MQRLHSPQLADAGSWHTVRIPATTANLGSGYDTLALALNLSFDFAYRRGQRDVVTAIGGVDGHLAPKDPTKHLFFRAADFCSQELDLDRPRMELVSSSEAPLRAGLGSSAAVRLAGVLAVAQLAGITLKRDEAFSLLVKLEGHPDNAISVVDSKLPEKFDRESPPVTARECLPCGCHLQPPKPGNAETDRATAERLAITQGEAAD